MMDLLRKESVFWSKLGFCYDPPRLDEQGKAIVFAPDFEPVMKFHKDFYKAGIRLHTSILFNGWVGVDRYDYELTDRVLEAIFSCGEDLLYIPRIKLNVPPEWCRANPEEVFVFENGPRSAGEIADLVMTPKHDILGYQSEIGYYTAGAWKDNRPNKGGVIGNQSFSSRKWLHDAGVTLEKMLDHLLHGPYASRIPAIHIAYGISGESCVWGRFEYGRFGDWGIANRRNFFDWGVRRYGSEEALAKAWDMPDISRNDAPIPAGTLREGASDDPRVYFRTRPEDRIAADYERFMGDVNVAACEHFASIIKRRNPELSTGIFYGYMMEVSRSAYTGHLNFEKLLKSPSVDFLCGPKSYQFNTPGEPGGELGPAQSVNLQKVWLEEIDIRTHLAGRSGEQHAADFAETRRLMWREFSKSLSHGSGMWWMDLGGGWFDDPAVLNEVSEIEHIARSLRLRPGISTAEVLVLIEEDSFFERISGFDWHQLVYIRAIRELQQCGLTVDVFRVKDLPLLDTARYRMAVMLEMPGMTVEKFNQLRQYLPECTFLHLGVPGGAVSEVCRTITGMDAVATPFREKLVMTPEKGTCFEACGSVEYQCQMPSYPFPVFVVEGGTVLGRYDDAHVCIAQKGRHILAGVPLLHAEHFRVLFEQAGCGFIAPVRHTVYGDSRFHAVFPNDSTTKFTFEVHG